MPACRRPWPALPPRNTPPASRPEWTGDLDAELSTVISLLLCGVGPLVRRGLPHLAMAAMATLVCGAALTAGHALLAIAPWLASAGGR